MTDPIRVPPMTAAEIEQAFSDTVGPLTFADHPYDIKEPTVTDPTTNAPWVVSREQRQLSNGILMPWTWHVRDSTGGEVVSFRVLDGRRSEEQAEALARMVAAGPDAERLRAGWEAANRVAELATRNRDDLRGLVEELVAVLRLLTTRASSTGAPWWCDTIAGRYCCGQTHCTIARAALARAAAILTPGEQP